MDLITDPITKELYDECMARVRIRMLAGLERMPDGVWVDQEGNEYSKPGTYDVTDHATLTINEDCSIEVVHTNRIEPVDIGIENWDVGHS